MGYLHIPNLYRPEGQDILLFKECYALNKVHGTSAHISFKDGKVHFFSGGEKHENFVKIFDAASLLENMQKLQHKEVVIFGEAYGGAQQKMSATYGKTLRFIVFDVKIGDVWLTVPDAESVALGLGLEFVPYRKVSTDLAVLDFERDRPDEVAMRRGCGDDKPREGVVLRPLIELRKSNGDRVIAKHKGEKFSERKTPQKVVDIAELQVLEDAKAIAQEWVTEMRLTHVLDKLPEVTGIEHTPLVIRAMLEDVKREAAGEIVESKAADRAISTRTVHMFHGRIKRIKE